MARPVDALAAVPAVALVALIGCEIVFRDGSISYGVAVLTGLVLGAVILYRRSRL